MNAQIPVELWTGHCLAQQLHHCGVISKPIASIFLSEEHFLTLDKEVRNLYSFLPLEMLKSVRNQTQCTVGLNFLRM